MLNTSPVAAFSKSIQELANTLETDPQTGLSADEVKKRLEAHGPNRLRRQKKKSALAILWHQFRSVIIWLLTGAAAMSFVMGDFPEGVAIACVLILNSAIGFFTELKAARSMEELMRIAEVRTRVRRGGDVGMIDAHELVPQSTIVKKAWGDTSRRRSFTASSQRTRMPPLVTVSAWLSRALRSRKVQVKGS